MAAIQDAGGERPLRVDLPLTVQDPGQQECSHTWLSAACCAEAQLAMRKFRGVLGCNDSDRKLGGTFPHSVPGGLVFQERIGLVKSARHGGAQIIGAVLEITSIGWSR